MKIAQIICQFRPYKSGMSEAAYNFSKELAMLEHEVTVFTPLYDKKLPANEDLDGFKIKRVKPFIKYGNAAFIPSIAKELKEFDIIHLHYPFFGTAEVVWLMRILRGDKNKIVITYHMDVVGKGILGRFFKLHTKLMMPRILRLADLITVSSIDYFKNSNAYDTNLEEKIRELPFGVDKTKFKPAATDKNFFAKYNLEADDKIILFIGALDKAHYFKGVEYLIKAFKLADVETGHCPVSSNGTNLKLVILGDGELKPYYMNLVGQLGIKDKALFAGRVNDEEKIKFLNACYMNILPSIDKSEAFGIVLAEAMACGKPVIASNLPGVRSVVEEGVNGLLCEPKNEEELAGKIKYLLDNPLIARQMGGNGFEKVAKIYNWEKIGERLVEIYTQLTK
ncbi:MAG: glycosyltransferase [bacterium]